MRRLLFLIVIAAAAGAGIWYALRSGGADATKRVTSLLPADTLVFVHVPDFNRALTDWRETDIYKLWREPAVQDFLAKPLTQVPRSGGSAAERLQELETIGARDGFVGVRTARTGELRVLGGFRYKGDRDDVEKMVGQWRAHFRNNVPATTQETVQHQRHRIEVIRGESVTVATAYVDNWYLGANDLNELRALLDRADGKTADASTLGTEANFTRAFARMPSAYAVAGYVRVDEVLARLAAKLPADGSARQFEKLYQVRNVAAATQFEHGKIHEVIFATTPKADAQGDLTRGSLSLTTAETFFYLVAFLNVSKPDAPAAAAPPATGFAARLQQIMARIAATGLTLEEWNSAFGTEFGVIGDWPGNARFPALLATLPVKDEAKANEIAMKLTGSAVEGSGWGVSQLGGATYYSQAPANPLLPVAPTIAIGGDRAIAGFDATSVDAAMQRAASTTSQLSEAEPFRTIEKQLPTATHSFAYLDTGLLYTRLDTALRPMLIMSAAFMPAIAEAIDLNKLPEARVITQHLSPIVLSQSYKEDGYLIESVGPVSAVQALFGLAGASGLGAMLYEKAVQPGAGGAFSVPPTLQTAPQQAPAPSPDQTP